MEGAFRLDRDVSHTSDFHQVKKELKTRLKPLAAEVMTADLLSATTGTSAFDDIITVTCSFSSIKVRAK